MADLKADRPILRVTGKPLCRSSYSCLPGRVVDFHKGSWDLLIPHIPKWAQNGNQDLIRAYLVFSMVPVTGLIGALLNTYFQKMRIRTQNSEQSSLRGEKPASLFPIGWGRPRVIGQYSDNVKKPSFAPVTLVYPKE